MTANDIIRQLRCPQCGDRQLCGPAEMLQRLHDAGMLRREAKPDWHLLLELLSHQTASLRCHECGQCGLILEEARDDFDDFDKSQVCEVCRKLIPPERLELFPDARRCAACQDKLATNADDYCAKCGGIVQVRMAGGAGVSRYVAVCSECGARQ